MFRVFFYIFPFFYYSIYFCILDCICFCFVQTSNLHTYTFRSFLWHTHERVLLKRDLPRVDTHTRFCTKWILKFVSSENRVMSSKFDATSHECGHVIGRKMAWGRSLLGVFDFQFSLLFTQVSYAHYV